MRKQGPRTKSGRKRKKYKEEKERKKQAEKAFKEVAKQQVYVPKIQEGENNILKCLAQNVDPWKYGHPLPRDSELEDAGRRPARVHNREFTILSQKAFIDS